MRSVYKISIAYFAACYGVVFNVVINFRKPVIDFFTLVIFNESL